MMSKTVNLKSMGESVNSSFVCDRSVIKDFDAPYSKEGGIAILKGNLAPNGCVVKAVRGRTCR